MRSLLTRFDRWQLIFLFVLFLFVVATVRALGAPPQSTVKEQCNCTSFLDCTCGVDCRCMACEWVQDVDGWKRNRKTGMYWHPVYGEREPARFVSMGPVLPAQDCLAKMNLSEGPRADKTAYRPGHDGENTEWNGPDKNGWYEHRSSGWFFHYQHGWTHPSQRLNLPARTYLVPYQTYHTPLPLLNGGVSFRGGGGGC